MRSLAAISVLTSEFATSKYGQTVIAIELVNEAFPKTKAEIATLEQFYRDGYQEVRKFGEQPVVLLSEAYQSLGFWSGFMPQPQYSKVALDVVSSTHGVHERTSPDHPNCIGSTFMEC